MIEVDEAVESVNGIFQNLLDQHSKPQTVELWKEPCKDGYGAGPLAKLSLQALLIWGKLILDLVKWPTKVIEKDLLDQHVHSAKGLQNQDQQEKSTHVTPKNIKLRKSRHSTWTLDYSVGRLQWRQQWKDWGQTSLWLCTAAKGASSGSHSKDTPFKSNFILRLTQDLTLLDLMDWCGSPFLKIFLKEVLIIHCHYSY